MAKRADQVGETRQRIVEATVHLHEVVGPAGTTVAGIAEAAGVTRLTVYRHFPDEDALFAACSAHWASQRVLPDARAWATISAPHERLRFGLTDLYRFYSEGRAMLTSIRGQAAHLPPALRAQIAATDAANVKILLGPFRSRSKALRAAIAHAVSFWTWRSLCHEQGLTNRAAVDLMCAMVLAATNRPANDENK